MYIYIYAYISICLSLSIYTYIHIYIYIYTHIHTCVTCHMGDSVIISPTVLSEKPLVVSNMCCHRVKLKVAVGMNLFKSTLVNL